MSQGKEAVAATSRAEASPNTTTASRFYWAMSGLLLLIVFTGFARTFFLRPLFDGFPIPTYVYVHGVVMTAWYVLFFMQPSLVAVGRTDLHRSLGIVTAIVGVAVIVSAAFTTLEFPVRLADIGRLTPESNGAFPYQIFWGDSANIAFFAIFLGTAILYRRKSSIHKRFMMLASISMISEAALRVGRFLDGIPNANFATVTVLFLILAMMAHDYIVDRRVHPVSLVGGLLFLLIGRFYFREVVATSDIGRTIVLNLAGVSG